MTPTTQPRSLVFPLLIWLPLLGRRAAFCLPQGHTNFNIRARQPDANTLSVTLQISNSDYLPDSVLRSEMLNYFLTKQT
jgi:hypothetical protein